MGNQWAECCDAWLQNKGRAAAKRFGLFVFFLLALVDVAVVFLLREAPAIVVPPGSNVTDDVETEFAWWVERSEEDYEVKWSWDYLVNHLTDYTNDVVDVLLLFLIRIVITMLLVRIAVSVGRPNLRGIQSAATSVQPLLINAGEGQLHQLSSEANKVSELCFFFFIDASDLSEKIIECRATSSRTTGRSAPR